ncbi:BZ3500_MvSof-1268-A1-R1_Chr2-3g05200 [Microbotryum saponariae]|uniref:BZ3500_MvSof-1268-A1-R1_Chr2-3g05200 protein n=1 Tax=Microbotryum saponariae TaxID=289078 RepID=A0A2X0K4U2_9BASI|nr:BZ3500_MvSof-1268-A1-R1_Chr2-3g05200 [Microbotryum saponariae]SDA01026.1 BZ3501_MvSof-1269-A2-R1_Chr2-2g04873 [Microbotryum saponariae]
MPVRFCTLFVSLERQCSLPLHSRNFSMFIILPPIPVLLIGNRGWGGLELGCIRLSLFLFFITGAHKLQSFGLAGTATKRAKRGYKATTASNWVKVKPLRAKSAAQIKTRRAPNADSNGR